MKKRNRSYDKPTAGRRDGHQVLRPMVLRAEDKQRLDTARKLLVDTPLTNAWQAEWNADREAFEAALATSIEAATPESWRTLSALGRALRRRIRDTVHDPTYLPPYIDKLTACTDAIDDALDAASGNSANLVPPEHDELVARITKLEEKTDHERSMLAEASDAPGASDLRQRHIDELFRRLDKVEGELAESKRKVVQVEQINFVNVDTGSVISLIRDALEALRHGVELLDDKRFSDALRWGAKLAWLTTRRYVRGVRQRFTTFELPWRQERVFEDFERREPNFGLAPDIPPGDDLVPLEERPIADTGDFGAMAKGVFNAGTAPPTALEALEFSRKGPTSVADWDQQNKNRSRPDLTALGLIEVRDGLVVCTVKDEVRSEDALRYAAAKAPTLVATREILLTAPEATGVQIAEGIARQFNRRYNTKASKLRVGNALRRWAIWLEPHLANPAGGSHAARLRISAKSARPGVGAPSLATQDTIDRLQQAIDRGLRGKAAARAAGVSNSTLYLWAARGLVKIPNKKKGGRRKL